MFFFLVTNELYISKKPTAFASGTYEVTSPSMLKKRNAGEILYRHIMRLATVAVNGNDEEIIFIYLHGVQV